jgi:hypothetical protein
MLDLVELHVITGKARDVVRKPVMGRADIHHMVLQSHFPDAGSDCFFGALSHEFSS